jgi:transposase
VKAARGVIAVHHRYLQQEHPLAWLKRELSPLRDRIHGLLEQGERGRHQKTANFCAGLLGEYEALWTFCEVQGIDPTNNAAERALRHGVILRKVNGGTKSEPGNCFIERILSTRETCRLQRRSMLDYLTTAVTAARLGEPVPTLLAP